MYKLYATAYISAIQHSNALERAYRYNGRWSAEVFHVLNSDMLELIQGMTRLKPEAFIACRKLLEIAAEAARDITGTERFEYIDVEIMAEDDFFQLLQSVDLGIDSASSYYRERYQDLQRCKDPQIHEQLRVVQSEASRVKSLLNSITFKQGAR
jgi:hypothetical protein